MAASCARGGAALVLPTTSKRQGFTRTHSLTRPVRVPARVCTIMASSVKRVDKSDLQWKKELDAESFQVLRKKGTEPARTGEYDKFYPSEGHFVCKGCGNPLYSAESKFDSGCGWPAFDKCYVGGVKTETDMTFGMKRIGAYRNQEGCSHLFFSLLRSEALLDPNWVFAHLFAHCSVVISFVFLTLNSVTAPPYYASSSLPCRDYVRGVRRPSRSRLRERRFFAHHGTALCQQRQR
mmetsp:Transcript_25985/g.41725  ORF Transcript_25985/g.41725 Transcript_25985/m.41725 type:complete len:236 (+) Transcript_25985:23-730(+)